MKTLKALKGLTWAFSLALSSLTLTMQARADRVALISTDTARYDYFDLAKEALDYGAKFIVFPEWGFVQNQADINPVLLDDWQSFAKTYGVYVALNTRFSGRNTLFVWGATGKRYQVVRRDGNASPLPTSPSELSPLVLDTPFGRAGFLICDEARSDKFVNEMRAVSPAIDFIITPNSSAEFASAQTILERAERFDYWVDLFLVDTIGKFTFSGGNRTHVYRAESNSLEIHRYLEPFDFGSWENLQSTEEGIKYYISVHSI